MTEIKYSLEDIERVFKERVNYVWEETTIKKGIIVEWCFIYPNGQKCAFVEASFPVNPDNFDEDIGLNVCKNKIKNKLWEICGSYSIITGEKL